jgi:cysteinyl-tRNA synthetase
MVRELESLPGDVGDAQEPQTDALDEQGKGLYEEVRKAGGLFRQAMDDDFNTARAIGQVFGLVRGINKYLHLKKADLEVNELRLLMRARGALREIGEVLGLFTLSAEQWFKRNVEEGARERAAGVLDEEYINRRIAEREEARKKRDWDTADSIRQELVAMGLTLEDTSRGTRWKVKD